MRISISAGGLGGLAAVNRRAYDMVEQALDEHEQDIAKSEGLAYPPSPDFSSARASPRSPRSRSRARSRTRRSSSATSGSGSASPSAA